jgi:hypothetical protein
MTKITRSSIESTVINLFINTLRTYLVDPNTSTTRQNANWIRSSYQVEIGSSNGLTASKGSNHLIKPKEMVGFPVVIVEAFESKNTQKTIYVSTNVNYEVACELTIRLLDNNNVTRIGSLGSQIENILETYRSTFMASGITKLEWSNIPTGNYASDGSTYNERQIMVTFIARVSSWQTGV